MRRLLAALLLVLASVAPVQAEHLDASILSLSKWAGCAAALITSDQYPVEMSRYDPTGHQLYIGTAPGAPAFVYLVVVLHEIGHCLQRQEGTLWTMDGVERELDADRRAADLACSLGLDGRRMLHDAMVWANETWGYEGDPGHGTLVQRIRAGDGADACRVVPLQA